MLLFSKLSKLSDQLRWSSLQNSKNKGVPGVYPKMRDPNLLPKCYEMTDTEKMQSLKKSDQLLEQHRLQSM